MKGNTQKKTLRKKEILSTESLIHQRSRAGAEPSIRRKFFGATDSDLKPQTGFINNVKRWHLKLMRSRSEKTKTGVILANNVLV